MVAALDLTVITAGILGQAVIADRMIVNGDAAQTAANILGNQSLYRAAFTIFMIEMVAQIAASVLMYDLLKPVNRSAARLMAVIGVTGCGIKAMARLFFYAPLIILGGAQSLSALEPAQLQALSLAFIRINSMGAGIGLIFFGFEGLLRGWLIVNSGFLPRFLGVLAIVASLGWLTFLWPPLGYQAFMVVALVALVGVILTTGWLLVRGVDDVLWRERSALAATSIWR